MKRETDGGIPANDGVNEPAAVLGVPQSPLRTSTLSSLPARGPVESEVDVADQRDLLRQPSLATVDLPSDGSSEKSTPSTLADDSVLVAGASSSPLPVRKRPRTASDSDDDRQSAPRAARMGSSSGSKRGQARSRAR